MSGWGGKLFLMRAIGNTSKLSGFSFNTRDLMRASCQHCTRLSTARELGVAGLAELLEQFWVEPSGLPIRYGLKFEADLEAELQANVGDLLQAPASGAPEATVELMAQGVAVIYQAVLRGGSGDAVFSGRPDFLVRADYQLEFGPNGLTAVQLGGAEPVQRYTAWDAKLSANARPEHLMQLGLYADALAELGFLASGAHGLILGNRELRSYSMAEVESAMLNARAGFFETMRATIDAAPAAIVDLGPLYCDASSFCMSCEYPSLCDSERRRTEHLALVSGINRDQIAALNQAGVHTVGQLAQFSGSLDEVSDFTVDRLSRQARVQLPALAGLHPSYEVFDLDRLRQLPPADPGDLFFDLEGFSFYEGPGGLEYLFGWVTPGDLEAAAGSPSAPQFEFLWADDHIAERDIFETFVDFAVRHLATHPDAHIYHYANYEVAALKRLAERHQSREREVQRLLTENKLIDLYTLVKQSLVIGQESYSLKKLEIYYTFSRSSQVTEALGSMDYYENYRNLQVAGSAAAAAEAESIKRQVLDYNRDDCVSTLALYRWLGQLALETT